MTKTLVQLKKRYLFAISAVRRSDPILKQSYTDIIFLSCMSAPEITSVFFSFGH